MQVVVLDAHTSSIAAVVLDLQAAEPKTELRRFATDVHGILELTKLLRCDDMVLLGATTNAFWLHDQFAGRVRKCYVLNTGGESPSRATSQTPWMPSG